MCYGFCHNGTNLSVMVVMFKIIWTGVCENTNLFFRPAEFAWINSCREDIHKVAFKYRHVKICPLKNFSAGRNNKKYD